MDGVQCQSRAPGPFGAGFGRQLQCCQHLLRGGVAQQFLGLVVALIAARPRDDHIRIRQDQRFKRQNTPGAKRRFFCDILQPVAGDNVLPQAAPASGLARRVIDRGLRAAAAIGRLT